MPYKNIVFIKLEKRLFNDPRWYMMSEEAQLNYIRFILFAAETFNKIPKNLTAIKKGFKTDQDEETIERTIKEIKRNFPKFKENKHFYYFKGFEEKTNYIAKKEIPGKSQGIPSDLLEKEKEKDKDKDKEKEKDIYIVEIIDFLNQKTNSNFKPTTPQTQKFIRGRLNEGYTIEDFRLVIEYKTLEWQGTEMEKYLRPSTLFRPSNFENYLNTAKKELPHLKEKKELEEAKRRLGI